MVETEKTMVLMTNKIKNPGTGDGDQIPWALPVASWTISEKN